MRNMFINCIIATTGAVLCCSLLRGLFWINLLVVGPFLSPQAEFETLPGDQIDESSFEAFHDQANALLKRAMFISIPVATLIVVACVGFLSRHWQWVWLSALVALIPAAAWVGCVTSINIGVAAAAGSAYLVGGAAIASVFSWLRCRNRDRLAAINDFD